MNFGIHCYMGAVLSDISCAIARLIPIEDYRSAIALACVGRATAQALSCFRAANRVMILSGEITLHEHLTHKANSVLHGIYKITGAEFDYINHDMKQTTSTLISGSRVRYIYGTLHGVLKCARMSNNVYARILSPGRDGKYIQYRWYDDDECIYVALVRGINVECNKILHYVDGEWITSDKYIPFQYNSLNNSPLASYQHILNECLIDGSFRVPFFDERLLPIADKIEFAP